MISLHLKIKDNKSNTTACGLNTQSTSILVTENFNQVDCNQCIIIATLVHEKEMFKKAGLLPNLNEVITDGLFKNKLCRKS